MASILALALLISISVVTMLMGEPVSADPASGLRVGPHIEVILSDLEDGHHQYHDIVGGAKSCGGPGKMLTMRYEPCDSSPGPCQVPSDNVMRRAELHFAPSRDIASLGVRVIVSTEGISPTVVYDKIFENNEVYKGNKYLLSTQIAASKMFQGKTLKVQFEVYKQIDGIEICSVAEFYIL